MQANVKYTHKKPNFSSNERNKMQNITHVLHITEQLTNPNCQENGVLSQLMDVGY